jgi:hypothetical protein
MTVTERLMQLKHGSKTGTVTIESLRLMLSRP